jgi:hypothetical protein
MDEYEKFVGVLEKLEEETRITNELYDEIKTHYDIVKDNSRKMQGSLTFLSKQAENLIQLRNSAAALIKASVDVQHKAFSNNIKVKMINIKQEQEDDGIPFKVVKYLIDALKVSSNQIVGLNEAEYEVIGGDESDEFLDARLIEDKTSEKVISKEIDEDSLEMVCDEMGNYHVVSNGTIVCDDDYDLPEGTATFDIGINGELLATDNNGKKIKIVRSDLLEVR